MRVFNTVLKFKKLPLWRNNIDWVTGMCDFVPSDIVIVYVLLTVVMSMPWRMPVKAKTSVPWHAQVMRMCLSGPGRVLINI